MSWNLSYQRVACKLLMGARGESLRNLKCIVDQGGDVHTLFKLVYRDIGSQLREELLKHIWPVPSSLPYALNAFFSRISLITTSTVVTFFTHLAHVFLTSFPQILSV